MQLSQSEQNILNEFNSRMKSANSHISSIKPQNTYQTKGSGTIQTNLISHSDLNISSLQNDNQTYIQEDGDTSVGYYNPQKSYSSERQQLRFGAGTREQSQVKCVFELQHDDDDELDQSSHTHQNNRSLLDDTRKFYSNIKKSNNNSAKNYKINNILSQQQFGVIDDQNYHTFSNNMYNTINSGYAPSTNPNLNSQVVSNLQQNNLLNSQNQMNLSLFHSTNNNSFNQHFDRSPPHSNQNYINNPYFLPKSYMNGSSVISDQQNISGDYKKEIQSQNSTQNMIIPQQMPQIQYSDYIGQNNNNNNNNNNKQMNQQLSVSYSNHLGGITSASQRNISQNSNYINQFYQQNNRNKNQYDLQGKLNGVKRPSSKQLSQGSNDYHQISSNIQTQASYDNQRIQSHYQQQQQSQQNLQNIQRNSQDRLIQNKSFHSGFQDDKNYLKSSLLSQLKEDSNQFASEYDIPDYDHLQESSHSNKSSQQQDSNNNKNNNIINQFSKQFSKDSKKMNEQDLDEDDLNNNNNNYQKSNRQLDLSQKQSSDGKQNYLSQLLQQQINFGGNLNNLLVQNDANKKRQGRFQITDLIAQYNKNSRIKIIGVKNYEKHQEHDIFFNEEIPIKTEDEDHFFQSTAKKYKQSKEFTEKVVSPGRDFTQNQKKRINRDNNINNKILQSNKENQDINMNNQLNKFNKNNKDNNYIKESQQSIISNTENNQYRKSPEKEQINSASSVIKEDRIKQLFSFQKEEQQQFQAKKQLQSLQQNKLQMNLQQQFLNKNDIKDDFQSISINNNTLRLSQSQSSQNQLNISQQNTLFSPSKRIQGLVQEVSQQSLQNGCINCNSNQTSQFQQNNNNNQLCHCQSNTITLQKNKESVISNDSVFYYDLKNNNHNHKQMDSLISNQRTFEGDDHINNNNNNNEIQSKQYNQQNIIENNQKNNNLSKQNYDDQFSSIQQLNQQQQPIFYNPYMNENEQYNYCLQRQNQPTPTLFNPINQNKSNHSTERKEYIHILKPKNTFQNEKIKKNMNMPKQQQQLYQNNSLNMKKTSSNNNNKANKKQQSSQQNFSFNKITFTKPNEQNNKLRSKSLIEKISKDVISKDYIAYIIQNHASCCRNFRKELNQSFNQ